MGNKLSCSCAPLIRKAYRYEDSPWQTSRRRDGHLLRLWAEVFHVSASGAGTVKWQQVSEDLVPVNITCIQDSPECVFHITAYNSQVDKILDVRLLQPGTRIGQASECFVYWKDPMTNDTWGLNFTSPIDAKQFRECCSPSFKFSRKASSSYSLKLDPPGSKQKMKAKRKPLSTPASPNRSSMSYSREPQCTCMTAEQYARLRAQDPRYRSSTLPRTTGRISESEPPGRQDNVAAATSSTSLYDNVASAGAQSTAAPQPTPAKGLSRPADTQTGPPCRPPKSQETSTMTSNTATAPKTVTASVGTQNTIIKTMGVNEEAQTGGSVTGMPNQATQMAQDLKSEGVQAGGTLSSTKTSTSTSTRKDHQHHILTSAKSVDYGEVDVVREAEMRAAHHHNVMNNNPATARRSKSKSTEDMNMDSSTLKRMLKPMPSTDSPVTSPEMGRRRYGGYAPYAPYAHGPQHVPHAPHAPHAPPHVVHGPHLMHAPHHQPGSSNGRQGGPGPGTGPGTRFSASRSAHEIGRPQSVSGSGYPARNLYLELERDLSPPSDNVMFDNQCYATTPSSSNGNSDQDQPHCQGRRVQDGARQQHHHPGQQSNVTPTPGSPTSRLLLEYEMHLRNTLAKGMDAESYSLHTFEALLTQSMEDLELAENLPGATQRSPYPQRRRPASQCSGASQTGSRSSTLPLPHRVVTDRPVTNTRDGRQQTAERDGYYSDRNELIRERERDKERERGYLSDHNTRYNKSSLQAQYTDRLPASLADRPCAVPIRACADADQSDATGGVRPSDGIRHLRERARDRDQGYLSDHYSSHVASSRCPSCIGEASRAQWYRHSDGGRGAQGAQGAQAGGSAAAPHRRSPWDSLPSLRHEGSLNDSGYKSNRADSFEQRGMFDRQDSLRSDYMSDRESQRYGMVQQASIDSTDSRLCYLTSSEVSPNLFATRRVILILIRGQAIWESTLT